MKRAIQFVCMWIVFLVPVSFAFAQAPEYVPLAPIPGVTEEAAPDLNTYIQSIYNISIGIGVVLAILMITIAGLQYSSSVIANTKSAARNRILGAVLGLLLLLSSVLILNTINPELTELDVDLTPASVVVEEVTFTDYCVSYTPTVNTGTTGIVAPTSRTTQQCFGTPEACQEFADGLGSQGRVNSCAAVTNVRDTTIPYSDCSSCVNAQEYGLNIKDSRACGLTSDRCQLNETLAERYKNLQDSMGQAGIDLQITEGYPPSVTHASRCHQTGTCIDANFTDRIATRDVYPDILTVVDAADDVGMYAVFEFNTDFQVNRVRQYFNEQGRSDLANNVIKASVTAPHFSIYRSRADASGAWNPNAQPGGE